MNLEYVRTPRMTAERLRAEHLDELCALLLDPQVVRTTWPSPEPPTREDVARSLAGKIAHWERFGFGFWLLRDRHSGEMVGRGGLQHTYTSGLNALEAAWAIVPGRWGRGLGTELAQVSLRVAFEPLGAFEVVAFTLPDNLASRRVMEKTGFRYEAEVVHAGLPHVLYRCERSD